MRINLLPLEYRPLPLLDSKRMLFMIISSVLVCSSLFGTFFFYLQLNGSLENLGILTQQLQTLQPQKRKVDQAEKRLADIKKKQDEVNRIKKSYPDYVYHLNKFANSLVDELWFKNVIFSPGKISIKGDSMSFAIIGDLLRNLDRQNFNSVRLLKVSQQEKELLDYYEFDIDIETREGGVEYAKK